MDSLITAAARALSAGDPLGALNWIALRDDAPALALRGIAMAQLGDLERARALMRCATRAFGPRESVARARCVVAEAEIAFALRDLGWAAATLESARITLEEHGDRINAAHARYLEVRRLLLIGRLDEAQALLASLNPANLPWSSQAIHALVIAGIAMRRVQAKHARKALASAERTAEQAGIPALSAEVESARAALEAPVARHMSRDGERLLRLHEVETLFASKTLVVDACRYVVRDAKHMVVLSRRPILFALARALAHAWPHDALRESLIAHAFRTQHGDESHRARLRVEMGRLRKLLRDVADIAATPKGFVLHPHQVHKVAVLAQPVEERHASVLALLADGEAWSSSALAMALDTSQRSVQRALDTLLASGKVQSFGFGRARRWTTPSIPGFATILLLRAPLPSD